MYLRTPQAKLIEVEWPMRARGRRIVRTDPAERDRPPTGEGAARHALFDSANAATAVASTAAKKETHALDATHQTTSPTPGAASPFRGLRDPAHAGHSRPDKELLFADASPSSTTMHAKALEEINAEIAADTGGEHRQRAFSVARHRGLRADGRSMAGPARSPRRKPIVIRATSGRILHSTPGGTVGDWPLNVFDEDKAAAELRHPAFDRRRRIHNLVFQTGGTHGSSAPLSHRPEL